MLAILRSSSEIIICEVDSAGQPMTGDYFTGSDGDQRYLPNDDCIEKCLCDGVCKNTEYVLERVDGPIRLTSDIRVESERVLMSTE